MTDDTERMARLAEGAVLASMTGGIAVLSLEAMLFLADSPESEWLDAMETAAREVGLNSEDLTMQFVVNLGDGIVAGVGADGVTRKYRLTGSSIVPLDPGSEAA